MHFTKMQGLGNDYLYVYDGTSTAATQIGQYCGSNSPGTVIATNDDGALTFRFTSDGSVNQAGWRALIHCLGIAYDPIEITVTADPETINDAGQSQLHAVATGGSGFYTYSWEPAEFLDYDNIANPIATLEETTEFKVTVTDTEGNSAQASITITVVITEIGESALDQITVYPNPTNGILHIEGIHETTNYRLFNSLGQVVMEGQSDSDLQINVKPLGQGFYFMEISNSLGVSTRKIIVE